MHNLYWEMKREVKALKKESEDLMRQLAYHDNPNTLPSRKSIRSRHLGMIQLL